MAVKGDVKEANATLHNECKKPSENTKRGISRFPQLNNRKDGVVTERLVRDALVRDRKSQFFGLSAWRRGTHGGKVAVHVQVRDDFLSV
jgi:hypothetical protein